MALTAICLVYVSQLLFGGVSLQAIDSYHYSRAGDNATLPCVTPKYFGPLCFRVTWIYYKDASSSSIPKVSKGQIQDSDYRLKLNADCSLTVQNVSAQDSGLYVCGQTVNPDLGTNVFLSVLTASPSPDSSQHGTITLRCTLWSYTGLTCSSGRFLWLDQVHKEVLSVKSENCESDLTVELQSPHSRTFICQYQEGDHVPVSAEYRLLSVQPEEGWSWFLLLKTLGWSALICTTVVVSICTRDKSQRRVDNA